MALVLLCVFINSGKVPFVYESWIVYGEILVASGLNMIAMNLTTIANQNANPATVGLFMFIGVGYNFLADYAFFTLDLTTIQICGLTICLVFTIGSAVYKVRRNDKKLKK